MNLRLKCFVSLLTLSAVTVHAETSSGQASNLPSTQAAENFTPAQFRLDKFSLLNNLSFPRGNEDVGAMVRCIVGVERSGRMRNGRFFYCVGGNDETAKYEQRVLNAMTHSKMKAATVNGKKTHATMWFSVVFERNDGVERFELFSNHLLNMAQFGTHYIAPQLIHDSAKFGLQQCALNLIARVNISAEGNVAEAKIEQGDASDKCKRQLLKRIRTWKFIPGYVDSRPVAMDHLIYVRWLGGWI